MFNARYSSRRAMIAALVEQVTLNHGSHRRVGRHVTEYATKNPRSEIPRQVRPFTNRPKRYESTNTNTGDETGYASACRKVKSRFGASTRLGSSVRLAPPNTAADL
jgi:hypothetical protein